MASIPYTCATCGRCRHGSACRYDWLCFLVGTEWFREYSKEFFDCACIDHRRCWKVGVNIWRARACNGVWGLRPHRGPEADPLVRGRSAPKAESLLAFIRPAEGFFCRIHKRQLFVMHVSVFSFHASRGTATYEDNKLNTKNRRKPMREEVTG